MNGSEMPLRSLKIVRTVKLASSIYIIGIVIVLSIYLNILHTFPQPGMSYRLGVWTGAFFAPLALGITMFLDACISDRNIIVELVVGRVAVFIVLIVSICILTYIDPPERGGLMVAHHISFAVGSLFSLLVLGTHVISRVIPIGVKRLLDDRLTG